MTEIGGRLRRYLVLGLIVVAPLGVTAFVLRWLFQRIDVIIGRYLPPIAGVRWPGLGIAALIALLLLAGWISDRALGRRALARWNNLLAHVPLVRRIHGTSSRVVQAVLDREEDLFSYCALIEYPGPDSWALAFATARAPGEVEEAIDARAVTLFLPTVPNPTSGYLLILPEERVRRLEMSVEDGFRMILSVGAAVPAGDGGGEIQLAREPGGAPPGSARRAEIGDLDAADGETDRPRRRGRSGGAKRDDGSESHDGEPEGATE